MTPSEFAEKVLNELNEEFEGDSEFLEALDEIIERATSMAAAKREELGSDD